MGDIIKINIQRFLGNGSKIFSGRNEGIEARKILNLSQKDNDNCGYVFVIPSETYSISPSFFGGMLGDSVINLGEEAFREKYKFIDSDNNLKDEIKQDYEEGIYDAINGL